MAEDWRARRERSSTLALKLLIFIARNIGRPVARAVLWPVAVYYLLTAPAARSASRDYLRRVLGRAPGWGLLLRHFYVFATAALDRVYVFGGQAGKLDVRPHGVKALHELMDQGRGALMLTAHHGSFEMLRVVGMQRGGLPVRILMDRAAGAKANALLDAIDPELTASVIDTSGNDIDLVLRVKAALDNGEIVGIMADRLNPGDRPVEVQLLGAPAPLPLAPWQLALVLKVPVVMAFGLYRGGRQYDLYFEILSQGIDAPRRERAAAAARWAQAYADRLSHYLRDAPYNWFNFYRFWNETPTADGRSEPHAAPPEPQADRSAGDH